MIRFTETLGPHVTIGGVVFERDLSAPEAIALFRQEVRDHRFDVWRDLPPQARRAAIWSLCCERYVWGRDLNDVSRRRVPASYLMAWRTCGNSYLGELVSIVQVQWHLYIAAVLTSCAGMSFVGASDPEAERLVERLGRHPLTFIALAQGELDRALSIAMLERA